MNNKQVEKTVSLTCMRLNMIDFVNEYGYEKADEKLTNLFGASYTNIKEELYQWYDFEISGECNNVK